MFGPDCAGKRFIFLPCAPAAVTPKSTISIEVREQAPKKVKGICVVRMGGLGDLIMLSSGLRELKRRNYSKSLTFATLEKHQAFMGAMPFVDDTICVDDLKDYDFEKTIDLRFAVEPPELGTHCRGSWESYTMDDRSDAFEKLMGVYPCQKKFEVPVDGDTTERMNYKLNGKEFVLINGAMVALARSISPKYIEPLCSAIVKKFGINVVLVGQSQPWTNGVKSIHSDGLINLINKTTIPEMISLCYLAQLVITPDTGTLHIAGALKKKTIGVFGNINPRTRISYYPTVKAIYPHGDLKCIPCWDLHPCKMNGSAKCMNLTTPGKIIKTAAEMI